MRGPTKFQRPLYSNLRRGPCSCKPHKRWFFLKYLLCLWSKLYTFINPENSCWWTNYMSDRCTSNALPSSILGPRFSCIQSRRQCPKNFPLMNSLRCVSIQEMCQKQHPHEYRSAAIWDRCCLGDAPILHTIQMLENRLNDIEPCGNCFKWIGGLFIDTNSGVPLPYRVVLSDAYCLGYHQLIDGIAPSSTSPPLNVCLDYWNLLLAARYWCSFQFSSFFFPCFLG